MGLGVQCDSDIVCKILLWLTGIQNFTVVDWYTKSHNMDIMSFCLQQLLPSLLISACYNRKNSMILFTHIIHSMG